MTGTQADAGGADRHMDILRLATAGSVDDARAR